MTRPIVVVDRKIPVAAEVAAIMLLAITAFLAIPLSLGEIGLSWDALNHHIYLGWTAESPRFDLDVLAASYQSYQFPYLYWPVYKLAAAGFDGRQTGIVLALLYSLAVPPVWLTVRCCIPGSDAFDAVMRLAGVALAFLSGVILSLFDTTANDFLGAIPFMWALALTMSALHLAVQPRQRLALILIAGLSAGIAVACKLSNAPLYIALPVLWCVAAADYRQRIAWSVAGGAMTLVGFLLVYGYWGWQLWLHFGNPIFPYAHSWFEPIRLFLHWRL